jgi:hypothetical protein
VKDGDGDCVIFVWHRREPISVRLDCALQADYFHRQGGGRP